MESTTICVCRVPIWRLLVARATRPCFLFLIPSQQTRMEAFARARGGETRQPAVVYLYITKLDTKFQFSDERHARHKETCIYMYVRLHFLSTSKGIFVNYLPSKFRSLVFLRYADCSSKWLLGPLIQLLLSMVINKKRRKVVLKYTQLPDDVRPPSLQMITRPTHFSISFAPEFYSP